MWAWVVPFELLILANLGDWQFGRISLAPEAPSEVERNMVVQLSSTSGGWAGLAGAGEAGGFSLCEPLLHKHIERIGSILAKRDNR